MLSVPEKAMLLHLLKERWGEDFMCTFHLYSYSQNLFLCFYLRVLLSSLILHLSV